MKYPLSDMTLNGKEFKHIMKPTVNFGVTKAGISSTIHTEVKYGTRSLGGTEIFDPLAMQGAGQIAFLIKHYWKSTPSISLLRENLYTLQLEVGRGENILENEYTEIQQWIQTESCILEVWKFMFTNQIKISHLGTEVSTQRTNDACLTTHLAL